MRPCQFCIGIETRGAGGKTIHTNHAATKPKAAVSSNVFAPKYAMIFMASIRIHEFVQIEHHPAHLLERLPLQEIAHRHSLYVARRPAQGEAVRTLDLPVGIVAGFFT